MLTDRLCLILIFGYSVNARLFCNESESDFRVEFDSELLKYRVANNPNVYILNQSAALFNVTCVSRRAVDWRFDGLTAYSAVTVDRYRNHEATCHLMSLNFTAIDEQITGTYTCYEIKRTWKVSSLTLFSGVGGEGHYFRLHNQTIDIQPGPSRGNDSVVFPCGLNDPRTDVNLLELQPDSGQWSLVAQARFGSDRNHVPNWEFDRVHGFSVNASSLHGEQYKCEVVVSGSGNNSENCECTSDVVRFNYRRHAGPTFIPEAGHIVLPRNATAYQIQCSAPYGIYIRTEGPLTFDVSNNMNSNVASGITSVIVSFRADSDNMTHMNVSGSLTNVSCIRLDNNQLLKSWVVKIADVEFQPGITFDPTAAIAICYSSTVDKVEVFQTFCETDTECEFQKLCLTAKEDWKCPGRRSSDNIIFRNETSVVIDLKYRLGILSCVSTDLNAMISYHVRVDGEIALDHDLIDSFQIEILGNQTVPTHGTVTAECTASSRLFYSKLNLELWNGGKLITYVLPDMILQDEFMAIPGLFIRKVTFQVPLGEFDQLICFVEMYSPKIGYVEGTSLMVYRNSFPPLISGPKHNIISLSDRDFLAHNNLTCEVENWPNISWEFPPTVKISDVVVEEIANLTSSISVSELRIPSLDAKYEGVYVCVARNDFGITLKEFTVHINEEKFPWLTIAIVCGIILAFVMLAYIWWMVRRAVAAQAQEDRNEYPLEESSKEPVAVAADKPLQEILDQFHDGLWPLTLEEKEAFTVEYESNGPQKTEAEMGNYLAMLKPYDFVQYEIPVENVHVDKEHMLGSGEFGVVHAGKLKLTPKCGHYSDPVQVAIKTIKSCSHAEYVSSFLKELQILIYVGKHSNIVELVGACTKSTSIDHIYVVLKLCPNGSLEKYLRTRRKMFNPNVATSVTSPHQNYTMAHQSLNTQDLLRWAIHICSGMEFLAEKKVIHGDLACRNVLLDEDLTVKITDFGLARRLYEYTKYIKKGQTLLPWRWMAIESLQDLHFSLASDVWALGVTLWEIFSLAEIPYPGIVWSIQFVEQLRAGHRNVKPQYTSEEIFSIVKACWLQDPADRPTMSQVKQKVSSVFTKECVITTDYTHF